MAHSTTYGTGSVGRTGAAMGSVFQSRPGFDRLAFQSALSQISGVPDCSRSQRDPAAAPGRLGGRGKRVDIWRSSGKG
jgi:hypothetical protein